MHFADETDECNIFLIALPFHRIKYEKLIWKLKFANYYHLQKVVTWILQMRGIFCMDIDTFTRCTVYTKCNFLTKQNNYSFLLIQNICANKMRYGCYHWIFIIEWHLYTVCTVAVTSSFITVFDFIFFLSLLLYLVGLIININGIPILSHIFFLQMWDKKNEEIANNNKKKFEI